MLAKLTQTAAPLGATALERATHALMVLPFAKKLDGLRDVPALDRLRAALKRRDMKAGDLAKTPVSVNLADGGLCSFVMLDGGKRAFERQSLRPDVMLTAIDSDVIKTYVGLGLGVGIIAEMAFDPVRDDTLAAMPASHLFEGNTTRVGFRQSGF